MSISPQHPIAHDGKRRDQVEQAADGVYQAQLATRLVREEAHNRDDGGQAQHDAGDEPVTRRACAMRRVSHTVASWTVSTIEAARVSVTDTDTT
jgi:hypothetical protein